MSFEPDQYSSLFLLLLLLKPSSRLMDDAVTRCQDPLPDPPGLAFWQLLRWRLRRWSVQTARGLHTNCWGRKYDVLVEAATCGLGACSSCQKPTNGTTRCQLTAFSRCLCHRSTTILILIHTILDVPTTYEDYQTGNVPRRDETPSHTGHVSSRNITRDSRASA